MSQLSIVERSLIYEHRKLGKSFRWIAKAINRAVSTITREFKRNQIGPHGYETVRAQEQRDKRAKKSRKANKFTKPEVFNYVLERLKYGLSPTQIAGRMKKDKELGSYDGDLVSHEGIYLFIYRDKNSGGNLYKYLRRKRKKRKLRVIMVKSLLAMR